MDDDNTERKKRKSKWATSYSNMTGAQADERLGFRTRSLKGISVSRMLANQKYMLEGEIPDSMLKTKEEVYKEIVRYLQIAGYPTEADPDFKEGNIGHLVYATISPILSEFIRMTGRKSIQLRSEKEIVSTDGETGGTEEFVVVDLISVREERFIFVIEGKRSSIGKAMRQCLLAMKDMRDNNGVGIVYGFMTTGELWQMVTYDGELFKMTESFFALFPDMEEDKERWMKDYSVVVDCMYAALSNGGMVHKDVVVG
jgi:hypothetical protein